MSRVGGIETACRRHPDPGSGARYWQDEDGAPTQLTNRSSNSFEVRIKFCSGARGNHATMFKSSGKIGHGIYNPFPLLKKRFTPGIRGIYDKHKEI